MFRSTMIAAPLLLTTLLMSQEQPEVSQFTLSTDVELVILDVGVKAAKGGQVSGLSKDNFRIFDNSKAQTISHFTHEDIPVTVGLVIDNSGSMRAKRSEVVTAGLTFAHASNPSDEIFVVNFNDKVQRGLPEDVLFTDNNDMLRTALLRGNSEGRTSLYDALAFSLQHLEQGKMAKKTLVVVSDGGDNASAIHWPEVLRRVQESRATIYTIGIFDEDDRDRNPDVLRKLANISGGEYFELKTLDEVVPVCRKIASDIRTRYSLSYIPQGAESKDKVHAIKVTASEPSLGRLIVRTRTRYKRPETASAKNSSQ